MKTFLVYIGSASRGSPWHNAYCESFNSIFRTTCLDRWLFCSMTEARVVINQWLEEYNTIRWLVLCSYHCLVAAAKSNHVRKEFCTWTMNVNAGSAAENYSFE